jgi:CheY-like chemotaxis protein
MAKTILVADDNATIRKMLCRIFEVEVDYDLCAEAADGAEAVSLAKQHRPNLVILDLSMPVMSGLEAAREIKRIMPDVPIILFTIHSDLMIATLLAMNSPIDLVVAKTDIVNMVSHVRSLIPV